MNDRLFTLVGGALALLLLVWLLGGGAREAPRPASRPTSQDAGPAGLLGLYRWLEHSGVPVRRLHGRYGTLPRVGPAATGNLLIVAEPMVWNVRPTEAAPLSDWLRAGNHVMLLRSAAQQVDWHRGSTNDTGVLAPLGLDTEWLRFAPDDDGESDPDAAERQALCSAPAVSRGTIAGEQRRLRPVPGRRHPVLSGIAEIHVKTPGPTGAAHQAVGYDAGDRYWYPLLCDPQRRLPVFTAFRAGAGRVWALDYSEAFSNGNLDRGDNAQLFANLVSLALGPGGAVIFDDMHQGDSELYDPDAFFADPRLHGTLAFLLGMWLVWLLGYSNRFATPAAAEPAASLRDFARAVARLYARYLRRTEAADALFRHFFNDVRAHYRLPPGGEPDWDTLGRAPSRVHPQVAELRALHERLGRGRSIDLVRTRNLLLQVKHALS